MKVTDFRIDTVEMLEDKFWTLPQEVIQLFRAYASWKPAPPGRVQFEIPIYRWREIAPLLPKGMQTVLLGTETKGGTE